MLQLVPINPPALECRASAESSAISDNAQSVRKALLDIRTARERSEALFGPKNTLLSSLHALYADHHEANWDGEGALPISDAALAMAMAFIRALPDRITLPEIAAEPDGAISLDWAASKHRVFTLSIGATDRLAYAWLDGTDRGHGVARFDGKWIPRKIIEGIEGALRGEVSRSFSAGQRFRSPTLARLA